MPKTLTVQVRLAWWVRLYLGSVVVFARLTGMEPDLAKVVAMVKRGAHVRLKTPSQEVVSYGM